MTQNEISHYESLKKQDTANRKLIKKLQLDKQALKEQLILSGVSQQRELLIAFHKWQQSMWTSPNAEITENVVDVYLKSK
jgi:hypothetical protein